jgi:hypothetical protein
MKQRKSYIVRFFVFRYGETSHPENTPSSDNLGFDGITGNSALRNARFFSQSLHLPYSNCTAVKYSDCKT